MRLPALNVLKLGNNLTPTLISALNCQSQECLGKKPKTKHKVFLNIKNLTMKLGGKLCFRSTRSTSNFLLFFSF